ncbi:MAG: hypothetical protein ACI94Y_004585, partial [Maribacter sp.]
MKFLSKISLLILFTGLLLTSCQQEDFDEIIVEDPTYQPEEVVVNNLFNVLMLNTSNQLDLGCVTINYPFDFELASGSSLTINSMSDFEAALNVNTADPAVNFVFPIGIIDSEGNNIQVNSNEELGTTFAACIPNTTWDDASESGNVLPAFLFEDLCLDLVYPINMEDGSGNTYTANDELELIDICA